MPLAAARHCHRRSRWCSTCRTLPAGAALLQHVHAAVLGEGQAAKRAAWASLALPRAEGTSELPLARCMPPVRWRLHTRAEEDAPRPLSSRHSPYLLPSLTCGV